MTSTDNRGDVSYPRARSAPSPARATQSVIVVLLALMTALAVSAPHASHAEGQSDRGADTLPGTRTIRTRYYRIHTDIDPELVQDLSTRLDGMYEEYQRR